MRIAGLLVLTILFPTFAYATELININTADKVTLMELEGIGDTLANRIIEYRETNGPFSAIEDLIHPNIERLYKSTFDKIKDHITVGDASAPESSVLPAASSTPPDASGGTAASIAPPSSSGKSPEYIPIPVLRLVTGGTRTISSGADTPFTAVVYDNKGNRRDGATVTWSFGDGMRRTGASVYHKYYEPGEYVAVVRATTSDGGDALVETVITVKNAGITIASVSPRGITLTNSDSRTLDLSLWRLSMGGQEFKIPEDTQILAGRTVLFPSQVIGLPAAGSASLLYPSGEVAATYPAVGAITQATTFQPVSDGQLSSGAVSYTTVSEVEPIQSARTDIQTYEEAVSAPAAATNLAAAGAALSPESPEPTSRLFGIFKSPWALGFLGLMALAGGAFIFL